MLIPNGTIQDLYNNDERILKLFELHSKAIIALEKAVIQQQEEIEKLKGDKQCQNK